MCYIFRDNRPAFVADDRDTALEAVETMEAEFREAGLPCPKYRVFGEDGKEIVR